MTLVPWCVFLLLLAGCVELGRGTDRDTALEQGLSTRLDGVTSESLNRTAAVTLPLYVSAQRTYEMASGTIYVEREYRFGYLTQDPAFVREVIIDDAGTEDRIVPRHLMGSFPWVPVASSYSPYSLPALDSALDGLSSTFGTPGHRDVHSYFLSALGGTDVWVVTEYGTTSVRRITDAATGALLAPSSSLPTSGTISLLGPDMSMKEARPRANATARAWQPDAVLVAFTMSERTSAGHYPLETPEPLHPPETFMSVDLIAGDGRAPQWTFIYYSPTVQRIVPVTIYAMGTESTGSDLEAIYATATSNAYPDLGAYGEYLDSTDLAALVSPLQMHMYMRHVGPSGGYLFMVDVNRPLEDGDNTYILNSHTGVHKWDPV